MSRSSAIHASHSFRGDLNRQNTQVLPYHSGPAPAPDKPTPILPPVNKRPPPKSASFQVFTANRNANRDNDRAQYNDTMPTLPDRAPEALQYSKTTGGRFSSAAFTSTLNQHQQHQSSPRLRSSYRAAERGTNDLLPTTNTNTMNNRSRTSSDTLRFARNNTTPPEQLHLMKQSLRSRRSRIASTDDEPTQVLPMHHHATETTTNTININHNNGANNNNHNTTNNNTTVTRATPKPTWSDKYNNFSKPHLFRGRTDLMRVRRRLPTTTQILQTLASLIVILFVRDAYQTAIRTSEQLLVVKHEESMMMLHLKRLEEQSLHLHENMARWISNGRVVAMANGGASGDADVDGDLIKVQTQQLLQMEDELSHQVKTLQTTIQQSDRAEIVKALGDGPVQVLLDLVFPDQLHTSSSKIAILLWYDTPHAAWTLIDQIQRGAWEGAVFSMDKTLAVVAVPPMSATIKKLEFVEKGAKTHEAWTVGLGETPQGEMSLFVNLQDNSQYHSHEVCVGKVIDGFDTLQRLTKATRAGSQVTIREATALHLTKRESTGLA
jgi:hypothetical protein